VTADRHLVKRLLRGDERAFEDFFEAYFPRLYRFALVRTRHDAEAAEEIVQATLTQVVRKLHTYRGEAALFSWLCTFCRHEISAHYRRENARPQPVDLVEDLPEVRAALESLMAAGDDPESELESKELAHLVQVALDQLHPRYGDALEWKYIQGYSVKEIASFMGVTPKAAESVLSRARDAFRDAFASLSGGWKTAGATPVPEV
jgi:RNA polymerase sigma-70 factor (ECF subfamily)